MNLFYKLNIFKQSASSKSCTQASVSVFEPIAAVLTTTTLISNLSPSLHFAAKMKFNILAMGACLMGCALSAPAMDSSNHMSKVDTELANNQEMAKLGDKFVETMMNYPHMTMDRREAQTFGLIFDLIKKFLGDNGDDCKCPTPKPYEKRAEQSEQTFGFILDIIKKFLKSIGIDVDGVGSGGGNCDCHDGNGSDGGSEEGSDGGSDGSSDGDSDGGNDGNGDGLNTYFIYTYKTNDQGMLHYDIHLDGNKTCSYDTRSPYSEEKLQKLANECAEKKK